jgi:DNA invertase Pin-like site-specific DNA recombinase
MVGQAVNEFEVVVEYERALIRARTRAALQAKRARGERVGAVPYGYLSFATTGSAGKV